MNELDQKIRAALKGSAVEDELGTEPNLAEELLIAFQGRNKFTNVMAFILSLGFLGLSIWSGIRFYEAMDVHTQLLWGGFCLFNVLFISFMKVWMWMEMQSNRVLREVKRVELLLLHKLKD